MSAKHIHGFEDWAFRSVTPTGLGTWFSVRVSTPVAETRGWASTRGWLDGWPGPLTRLEGGRRFFKSSGAAERTGVATGVLATGVSTSNAPKQNLEK